MAQNSELNLLVKAMSFAAQKHKDQRRKGKDAPPYINHPIDLAEVLVNIGNVTDVKAICAALLHDTIEDTRTTREELTEIFGAEISDIVMEVTDDKSLCKAARKQAQIDHAMHLSKQARAVKLADKICNLGDVATSPPNWSLARRQRYFDWAKNVIDGLRGEWNDLEAEFDRRYLLRPTR